MSRRKGKTENKIKKFNGKCREEINHIIAILIGRILISLLGLNKKSQFCSLDFES
jgi:hypothetical protein